MVIVKDTGRVDGGKEKEVKKEKEKKREEGIGLVIVGGAGRCDTCVREDTPCKISLLAIDKWWADVKSRMVFHKNLSGTNCKKCVSDRKKCCILPATKEMQDTIVEVPKSSKTSLVTLKLGGPPTRGSRATTRSRRGSSVPRNEEEVPRGGSRGGARLQEDEDSRDSHVTGGLLWGDGADDGE